MHLMQRNERPVLCKDEVVVPPPVVAAVPQLEHMEHTLTHLAGHLILVLHPLVFKLESTNMKYRYNLVDQAKAAPLSFLPFQQVGDAVFHSAGVWEEDKHFVADPSKLVVFEALFHEVVMEGRSVGP